MLGMMADFQIQQKSVQPTLAATSTVCTAQRSTSGVCQPSVTRINTQVQEMVPGISFC